MGSNNTNTPMEPPQLYSGRGRSPSHTNTNTPAANRDTSRSRSRSGSQGRRIPFFGVLGGSRSSEQQRQHQQEQQQTHPSTFNTNSNSSINNNNNNMPIDAWCDDGSLSRREPPWLKDRRLKHLQHSSSLARTPPPPRLYTTNPFEDTPPTSSSTNPFDSNSISDSSSKGSYLRAGINRNTTTTTTTTTNYRPTRENPNDDASLPPTTPNRNTNTNASKKTKRQKPSSTNPFDSSTEEGSSAFYTEQEKQRSQRTTTKKNEYSTFYGTSTNPFDTSTEYSNSGPIVVRPKIVRPSEQRRQEYESKDSAASVQDSLDQFLDTNDEASSSQLLLQQQQQQQQQEQQQQPPPPPTFIPTKKPRHGSTTPTHQPNDSATNTSSGRTPQHSSRVTPLPTKEQEQYQQQQHHQFVRPTRTSTTTPQQRKERREQLLQSRGVGGSGSVTSYETTSTTPSAKAQQAAEALRQSFEHRPTTTARDGTLSAPSTPMYQVPPFARYSSNDPSLEASPLTMTPSSQTAAAAAAAAAPAGAHPQVVTPSTTPRSTPTLPTSPGTSARPSVSRRLVSPNTRRRSQGGGGHVPVDLDPSLSTTQTSNVLNTSRETNTTTTTNGSSSDHNPFHTPKLQSQSSQNDDNNDDDDNLDERIRFALHDLCDEARDPEDLAWRNALQLLSVRPILASQIEPEGRMTPLHVCCVGNSPPPTWMTRALLYTYPAAAQHEDAGGRLALHLVAATTADLETMQLLVEEYPAAVAHRDARGFTPLHLLLKNDAMETPLELEHLRILLGQTHAKSQEDVLRQQAQDEQRQGFRNPFAHRPPSMKFRKGDHLDQFNSPHLLFQDLASRSEEQARVHEVVFGNFPLDVQRCLRKITQWKRRQRHKGLFANEEVEEQGALALSYENPASIPTPQGGFLALHLLVRRPPPSRSGSSINRIPQDHFEEEPEKNDDDDYDDDDDSNQAFRPPTPPPPSQETLARVLIHAYPQALIAMDTHGRTPLLTALLQSERLPSLELVEILLGKYTPGFAREPTQSPAKLASMDTLQLPLHVAAEEVPDRLDILSALVEAFPASIQVADVRGRTPLICALSNYRSIPLTAQIFDLLYDTPVAQMADADGKRPLDWILEKPQTSLVQSSSGSRGQHHYTCQQEYAVFERVMSDFLQASLNHPPPETPRQAQQLLDRLRALPPWLRRLACASQIVQETLLEEQAGPGTTALIFLQGLVWVGLLVVLRIALEDPHSYLATNPNGEWDSWILVQYFAAYQLVIWVIYFGMAVYLQDLYQLVFSNVWKWIDLASACTSLGVASLVHSEIDDVREALSTLGLGETLLNFVPANHDRVIATLGAWATGFVWMSLVGFGVQWWSGMAVFVGSAVQILTRALVWPLVIGGMGIVGMSQILYTLQDCNQVIAEVTEVDVAEVCQIQDAYTTVYWMILGQPILGGEDENGASSVPTSTIVVLTSFTLLWLWWLVSVLLLAVSEAYHLDRYQIARTWFWEPKVALTVYAAPRKEQLYERPTLTQSYCSRMERTWSILTASLMGSGDRKRRNAHWDAWWLRPGFPVWITRLLAVILLPVWLVVGVATLGILWPPQVRRWIFDCGLVSPRTANSGNSTGSRVEDTLTFSKLSQLKGDVQDYQKESLEQNFVIQQDLSIIKEILYRAMLEDDTGGEPSHKQQK